ncbi:MAG: glucoamylase family protein [Phycisphaerales bacterium]
MKSLSACLLSASAVLASLAGLVPACAERREPPAPAVPAKPLSSYIIEAPAGVPRPPFEFSQADDQFLDDVQRGAFNYFWNAANPHSQMVPDRTSKHFLSMAGVGFQLASICIGVERQWISREQGEARALHILRTLESRTDIRKAGLFYHFLEGDTAGQPGPDAKPPERLVSTIDSALLFCGVLTASSYFGGEIASIGDRLVADANWAHFVLGTSPDTAEVHANSNGFISLGWKPADAADPTGKGALLPYAWIDCGDEHRLVTFLAVAAPKPEHRVPPETYYKLRRKIGSYGDTGPLAYFPWSGALFVSTFAHCFLDHSRLGPDDPAAFGVRNRPRVDWWENARRTTRLHQIKCAENPLKLPTLSAQAWGLTASDKENGYLVAGVFPDAIPVSGALPELDYPLFTPKDEWGDGTIAPYAAGCTVMFDPGPAVAAMRYYASLKREDGTPLVWRHPDNPGPAGYGFRDAFNLGTGWAGPDDLAIDQGPLIVSIENARTGLIWKMFGKHPVVARGLADLKLCPAK